MVSLKDKLYFINFFFLKPNECLSLCFELGDQFRDSVS